MRVLCAIRRIQRVRLDHPALPRVSAPSAGPTCSGHDARELRREIRRLLGDRDRHLARDVAVDLRDLAVGIGDHGRPAGVRLLADADVERQRAQERHLVVVAHPLRAALAEDVLGVPAVASRRGCSCSRRCRRSGTPTFSNILRPLRASISAMSCGVVTITAPVTGTFCASVSWMSPVPGGMSTIRKSTSRQLRVLEQLLERLRDHRPAPDHRRVGVDHEADRHRLHAVRLQRLERLAVRRLGPAGDAEHRRLRRTVDVRVEHAHRRAFRGERERQVDGGRRLAHAALAARHRDDVLHARHELHAALHRMRDDLRA